MKKKNKKTTTTGNSGVYFPINYVEGNNKISLEHLHLRENFYNVFYKLMGKICNFTVIAFMLT